MATTLTKAQFARRHGWARSTVTRFAKIEKIVLTADGRVDVGASEVRLELARDPKKDGTRARHERGRKKRSNGDGPGARTYARLQGARAEAETHRAALLALARAEKEGQLVDAEAVRVHAFTVARAARNSMFNLQHRLDPLLAGESDPGKRAMLWDLELRAIADELAKGADGRG